MKNEKKSKALPLLPVKNVVVFPDMVLSLFLPVEKVAGVLTDLNNITEILVVSQKNQDVDNPKEEDLYRIGCLVEIIQIVQIPKNDVVDHDSVKLVIKCLKRVQLENIVISDSSYESTYSLYNDIKNYDEKLLSQLKDDLFNNFTNYTNSSKKISQTLLLSIKKLEKVVNIVDAIATHLVIKISDKQNLLEFTDIVEKVAYLNSLLEVELDLIKVEKKIRETVKTQMEKNQKDYYLNEQVKAIQKEINNGEEVKDEIKELHAKLNKTKVPADVKEKLEGEIKKLSMMNPISAESSVVRNYIEWVLNIPWHFKSDSKIDLKKAEKYLEENHYALNKVKERILDYLAVLKKSKLLRAPILCLVGPPGVGKTSLAKSIAKASGREFVRISLGGVRDEAEIRGHRRTYIGAMPGKIIQVMKKAKVSNPLILLDEIDKMGSDFRGDPASALLEVLDPEQNSNFVDHYIEVEYDLSEVMFITTANSLNIQEALLDRMEVIELNGYSEEEKLEIAKLHLIPRKMTEAALDDKEFQISDSAIISLIRHYTRESGVRDLDRVIAMVARKVAKDIVQKKAKSVYVDNNVVDYAGVHKFKSNTIEKENLVGITSGLAWTRVGGDILYIEALKLPGKGDVRITGKLGEVMQESVRAAYSLAYSCSAQLGIEEKMFKEYDIHIHVPEGAVPKDGPSAGITMLTSIVSVLTGKPVKNDVAMTGEITLRGRVLPIGGLREKILAALRAGIKTVIIPEENAKDLSDLPAKVLKEIKIIKVSNFLEVIENALVAKV